MLTWPRPDEVTPAPDRPVRPAWAQVRSIAVQPDPARDEVTEVTAVDPQEFRRVVGRFATGITVVSTYAEGVHHAMTVNSFTSVSLDPLLVLICVEKAARFHEAVLTSGTWAVSVLGVDGADASAWFATRGRPLDGQLQGYRWTSGRLTGAALLDDAIATLECRTTGTHDGGDHTIVVGEVIGVAAPDGPSAPPLLYFEGDYRGFSE